VGETAARLAVCMGLPASEVEILRRAAPLHDIGKIGIRDAVLLKPGPLDDDERAHIETHSRIGSELLAGSHVPILQAAQVIALHHHERWDGTGYPQGLRGIAIPLHARIVAVADGFDALTHQRPYKSAWPLEQALAEVQIQRERLFDPEIVDHFLALVASDPTAFEVDQPPLPVDATCVARQPRSADEAVAGHHDRHRVPRVGVTNGAS
jgi:putative two-component system response regulator